MYSTLTQSPSTMSLGLAQSPSTMSLGFSTRSVTAGAAFSRQMTPMSATVPMPIPMSATVAPRSEQELESRLTAKFGQMLVKHEANVVSSLEGRFAALSQQLQGVQGGPPSEWLRQVSQDYVQGIRTQDDDAVSAQDALRKLQEGNMRYLLMTPKERAFDGARRAALATHGQLPFAAFIGCADSRCPIETVFDVIPGDVFVLRNAGNTISQAEGSFVGSLEYSVGHLRTNLIMVMGHTKCGAIAGATKTALCQPCGAKDQPPSKPTCALEGLLAGLGPVALQAQAELPRGASIEEVAVAAIKVNVFHTMEKLLTFSKSIRDKVRAGEVEVQGCIYDIVTGEVEFLGRSPRQALVLDMEDKKVEENQLSENAYGA